VATIYISIGSNVEPVLNVRAAVRRLRQRFPGLRVSPVYETEAVGFVGDDFLNLVVCAEVDMAATAVCAALREIETEQGRDRSGPRFGSRTLDLDLLLYDDVVVSVPGLQLPRAEILQRAFVLAPLADLAPTARHPVTGATFAQLWADMDKDRETLRRVDFQW
jgi:2-amino-4-hydroxy-6-hydroxymethyldihydropteridine diphosphokinase